MAAGKKELDAERDGDMVTYTAPEDDEQDEVKEVIQFTPENRKRKWTIDRKLLAVKVHYLLYFGSVAGFVPFAMTYFMQLGANAAQVGLLYSVLAVCSLLSKPVFGAVADKFRQHKSVFVCSIALTVSAFFTIYFIPAPPPPPNPGSSNFSVACNATGVFATLCSRAGHGNGTRSGGEEVAACELSCFADSSALTSSSNFSLKLYAERSTDTCRTLGAKPIPPFACNNTQNPLDCTVNCNVSLFGESGSERERGTVPVQLYWFGSFMVLAYIGFGTSTSMGDTVALDILGADRVALFGRQRLWGAVGWGFFSIVTGQLIDAASRGSAVLVFAPAFFVVLALGVGDVAVASLIPVSRARETPAHLGRDSATLFASLRVAMFGVAALTVGVFTGILWVFLIVYLKDLGASQLLVGLSLGVQSFLGELPFFFVANWFIEKIGHVHSMTLVLAVFSARFFFYSLVVDPWTVLPIEVLHGVTFGVFFTALATFPSVVATPEMAATVQGIFQGLFEGFGVGVGYLLGGYLYKVYGGKMMFLMLSRVAVVACLVYGGIQALAQRYAAKGPASREDADKYLSNVEMQPMNSVKTGGPA